METKNKVVDNTEYPLLPEGSSDEERIKLGGAPKEIEVSGVGKLQVFGCSETVRNRFSGEPAILKPIEVAVYDYAMGCERFGFYGEVRKCITWFIENNVDAYYKLLD